MSDPARLDQKLVAYVDGELDSTSAAEIEALMTHDLKVRADVEMFRSTAMLLRAACGEQQYSAAPLATPRPVARGRQASRRRALAMAASFVLAAGGFAGGMAWEKGDNGLLAEIADYHVVIARETTHLAEEPPERSEDFAAWLGERLGLRLIVPDLRVAGLRYAGGRMLVVDGGPVADFLYTRDHGTPVAICVARSNGATSALRISERSGLRLAAWDQGGATYIVVGDIDVAAARRIASLVAAQVNTSGTSS